MDKYRQSKKWYGWVRIALIGQIPKIPFNRAHIRYVRYCGNRRPDDDNLESGFKWIQDGIVLAGVIPDDTSRYISTSHDWFPANKNTKRVLVEIEPIYSETNESNP